ncbi:glyoxalase [Marmoricola endophyticus]|uniref:Glyoxalase n=1 Tax=Marmoricola endophyticus TaxID=2040280 RepID=A0A917F6I8_9ACTN|nr:VOC family protein [Marmoricola endophyticus]GGF52564.1 glyoxalase [Marmoricola endophyticus]
MRLHHVQVSCPPGGEEAARAFWVGCLGMTEVPKPDALAGRGGCWFRSYDYTGTVTAEIHVGVEDPMTPARKAHPALVVDDLDVAANALRSAGHPVDDSERDTFPGFVRLHTVDPHGNRVELLAR